MEWWIVSHLWRIRLCDTRFRRQSRQFHVRIFHDTFRRRWIWRTCDSACASWGMCGNKTLVHPNESERIWTNLNLKLICGSLLSFLFCVLFSVLIRRHTMEVNIIKRLRVKKFISVVLGCPWKKNWKWKKPKKDYWPFSNMKIETMLN